MDRFIAQGSWNQNCLQEKTITLPKIWLTISSNAWTFKSIQLNTNVTYNEHMVLDIAFTICFKYTIKFLSLCSINALYYFTAMTPFWICQNDVTATILKFLIYGYDVSTAIHRYDESAAIWIYNVLP